MDKYIKSPFNYTGGKYKLLNQILPLFPRKTENIIDLFSGGCNVGINIFAKNKKFIDKNIQLIELINTLKKYDIDKIIRTINDIIYEYNLSNTSKFGYDHYGCTSSDGLAAYNKEKFIILRNDYNKIKNKKEDFIKNIMLYTLIIYGFNNQIRFNKEEKFNIPVGKRDFNEKIQNNLIEFCKAIKEDNCEFINEDFRNLNDDFFDKSFVYADPPYLITTASYNEQGGWNEECEFRLYDLLDRLNRRNIKFALSNVIENKGVENQILNNWINNNNYLVHYLDKNYNNSNYQIKDRSKKTIEVLVTNY